MVGLLRAFVHFILVVAAFAVLMAIGSRVRGFDYGINVLKLVLLPFVSAATLWLIWKDRKNPGPKTYRPHIPWNPKKWRKLFFGKVDDEKA